MAQRLGRVEQPSGDIQRVADIGDLAPYIADFAGDDLAPMQGGAELGHDAEPLPVLLAVGGNHVLGDERAGHTVAAGDGVVARPRQDRLVADILVDLRAAFESGIRDIAKEGIEQFMEADRPQPFGQAGGILHVDQDEGALLAARMHVATGQQILERAEAQKAAHFEHEIGENGHCDGEHHRGSEGVVEDLGYVVDQQSYDHEPADDHDDVEEDPEAEIDQQRLTSQASQQAKALALDLEKQDWRRNDQRVDDAHDGGMWRRIADGITEIGADRGKCDAEPENDPPFATAAAGSHASGRRSRARRKVS
ncbi:MAG: hypothetical protein OJF58_004378 [Enhydrobacter sp.]|nr:MAG: hypothetical protein OJF58_004378 [Enhydrobacter sp.]